MGMSVELIERTITTLDKAARHNQRGICTECGSDRPGAHYINCEVGELIRDLDRARK